MTIAEDGTEYMNPIFKDIPTISLSDKINHGEGKKEDIKELQDRIKLAEESILKISSN